MTFENIQREEIKTLRYKLEEKIKENESLLNEIHKLKKTLADTREERRQMPLPPVDPFRKPAGCEGCQGC